MSRTSAPGVALDAGEPGAVGLDTRPPGERYFRHPGDVVRLVLWGAATLVLVAFTWLATETSEGVAADLAQAAGRVPRSVRALVLNLAQLAALVGPVAVLVALCLQQRWRRVGVVLAGAAAGALFVAVLDAALDLTRPVSTVVDDTWLGSARFPSLAYLGGVAGAITVGKPWLGRSWRRAADITLAGLAAVIVVAAGTGAPETLLALAAGITAGAAVLVVFGAPNRRPTSSMVAEALGNAGHPVSGLTLLRAEEGRSQLYSAHDDDGERSFVKVYARDSRDADLLYRGYRTLLLRSSADELPRSSLAEEVEHEALLLVLAGRSGVVCPAMEAVTSLADGSMALALEHVDGVPLDEVPPEELTDSLLRAVWQEARNLHAARIAHRSLRGANVLVRSGVPVIIDLGFAHASADGRLQAIDRAELLASMAALVGPDRALAAAAQVLPRDDLAATAPYLQPLALTASTRAVASKSLLGQLRDGIAGTTGTEPEPLERLVRVRPRTLLTVATVAGAFYLLLPQLADVGDSFTALRSANYPWLLACVALSGLTYVGSAISLAGGVSQSLPFGPNLAAQLASSFVNRVTPANVGGMALNVRFMQKSGVEPAEALTGMGLNVIVGAVVHVVLLVAFLGWAGQSNQGAFKIPSSSKALVAVVVVLALAGIFGATRRGRRLLRTHVVTFLQRSWRSLVRLARSPAKLAQLFGGSLLVTLAYACALAAAFAAFHAPLSFAQVGAVYLGASIIAAAAPTPGGLGAMEAALVAGATGLGVEPGVAVAAVLSYRLATYWLPILPGWISFHLLERRNLI
jgi:uncharacterized protein (TIRG00374 family)